MPRWRAGSRRRQATRTRAAVNQQRRRPPKRSPCAPGRIRTSGPLVRSQMLFPAELRVQDKDISPCDFIACSSFLSPRSQEKQRAGVGGVPGRSGGCQGLMFRVALGVGEVRPGFSLVLLVGHRLLLRRRECKTRRRSFLGWGRRFRPASLQVSRIETGRSRAYDDGAERCISSCSDFLRHASIPWLGGAV